MMVSTSLHEFSVGSPTPIRRVLVGACHGQRGESEVMKSLEITRALGAGIHLTRAVPLEIGGSSLELFLTAEDVAELRESSLRDLDGLIGRLEIAPSELAGMNVEIGPPFKVVTETARRISADLLILWSSGREGMDRHLIGSTGDRILRCAPCATLVMRLGASFRIQRVLAPVDLSVSSALALRSGLQFLTQVGMTKGVEVETLFVLSPLQRHLASQFTADQIDKFALEELARFTRENSRRWKGWVRSRLRVGEARHQVVRELEEHPADLVVVGSHGHGFQHRALLGSVTAQLARTASCAVFVGPPAAPQSKVRQLADEATRAISPPSVRSAVCGL